MPTYFIGYDLKKILEMDYILILILIVDGMGQQRKNKLQCNLLFFSLKILNQEPSVKKYGHYWLYRQHWAICIVVGINRIPSSKPISITWRNELDRDSNPVSQEATGTFRLHRSDSPDADFLDIADRKK
jgi:hypothetical protein